MKLRKLTAILLVFLCFGIVRAGPNWKVIQSNTAELVLNVEIEWNSVDDLKPIHLLVGIPGSDLPLISVDYRDLTDCPGDCPDSLAAGTKWTGSQLLRNLYTATLMVSPSAAANQYYRQITISISFNPAELTATAPVGPSETAFFSNRIVNWNVAKQWLLPPSPRAAAKRLDLPDGNWLRFVVNEDGMTAVSGSDILDAASTLTAFDPRSLMLFTGSSLGRARDQSIVSDYTVTENLLEIAVRGIGFDDGRLDPTDRLLFYGRGASGYDQLGSETRYHQNLYFSQNTYWLLIPNNPALRGKHVSQETGTVAESLQLNYGVSYLHYEIDAVNPAKSGLGWVGVPIESGTSELINITIPNPSAEFDATLRIGILGGTSSEQARKYPTHVVRVYSQGSGGQPLLSLTGTGKSLLQNSGQINGSQLTDGSNTFTFSNESTDIYSRPYFDYLDLAYGRELVFDGESFEFISPIHSNPVRFNIQAAAAPQIWEITDLTQPKILPLQQDNSQLFILVNNPVEVHSRIIVFDPEQLTAVTDLEFMGEWSFDTFRTDSRQARHLILAPAEFENAVQELTDYREQSVFVDIQLLYDEFSGGNPDPMAIRSFVKWTQDHWLDPKPIYLLIMGDADYDYRNLTGASDIKIPTIEVGIAGSYATDDRLATVNGPIPSLAMGRFPAQTPAEAQAFVAKTIEFEVNPELGPWRRRVLLVADDAARPEDSIAELYIGKSHTFNSELLSSIIPESIEIHKLYMMEYPEVSDATSFGVSKPQATAALFEYLTNGMSIVNYIGHGSAHQWAQERLLFQDRDLGSIETGAKLPLWIAGTCSWGHFDDVELESFSEELIRFPRGGASSIITTSRPITVTSNQFYEEQLFSAIFPQNQVTTATIGQILLSVKNGNREGEFFHLFGDPAMKLSLPVNSISISGIEPDTLRTLETAEITGKQNITLGSGIGYLTLFDAGRHVTREYNFLSTPQTISYNLPGPTLFRGKFSFQGNDFSGKLRVPKDISYALDPGKISIYMQSNDTPVNEAIGAFTPVFLTSGEEVSDSQGPIISFETASGRVLRTGDHLQLDEALQIRLSDPLGINLTGEPGHEIKIKEVGFDQEIDVTDQFIYDLNSISTGTLPITVD
ncbi:MAG: C25 family cysteine peptidase, partial [Nitrospinaceae bacterium]